MFPASTNCRLISSAQVLEKSNPTTKLPGLPDESTIGVMAEPEQIVCDAGVATTVGIGLTKTVAVIGVPVQVVPPLV